MKGLRYDAAIERLLCENWFNLLHLPLDGSEFASGFA
jgi:hypothetical protein